MRAANAQGAQETAQVAVFTDIRVQRIGQDAASVTVFDQRGKAYRGVGRPAHDRRPRWHGTRRVDP